jgi:YgiT-type zinc finger domain-containing protein
MSTGTKNEDTCPVCKGKMENGITDLSMRRKQSVVIVEEIPALVCSNCGEAIIESMVAQKAYDLAAEYLRPGKSLEFCKFDVA